MLTKFLKYFTGLLIVLSLAYNLSAKGSKSSNNDRAHIARNKDNFQRSSAATGQHKLLLISLDGLRGDYVTQRRGKNKIPNMERLIARSAYAERLKPAFPSITSPCHTTMATGTHPDKHGVLSNMAFHGPDDKWDRTFNWYDTMDKAWWWDAGAEPIWITAVKQGLKSGVYHFPGSYVPIQGHLATRRELITRESDVFTTDSNFEAQWRYKVDKMMTWLFYGDKSDDHGPLDLGVLYFGEPDHSGHKYGPNDTSSIDKMLSSVDQLVGYILDSIDRLGVADKLNVILTSDHGMLDFDPAERLDYWTAMKRQAGVNALGKYSMQIPQDSISWLQPRTKEKGDELFDALKIIQKNQSNHIEGVYRKTAADAVDRFPIEYRVQDHPRTPDILIAMKPGYVLYPIDPLGVAQFISPMKGDHGWNNTHPAMQPALFAFGPNFKSDTKIVGLEQVDIYNVMARLLNLEAPENIDGKFTPWESVLRNM